MATPISSAGPSTAVSNSEGKSYKAAFIIICALFFSFGFITCLNDILIPHLKGLFTLSYTEAALIQFCFFSAYFVASLPAGSLVSRIGYKQGTIVGTCIAAGGCLLFYPAAQTASYAIFLLGLFVLACGITLIQVAVNPYVAALGSPETASGRLTLAQAFNSLGTTIAPMFGSLLILSSATDDKAGAVQRPYVGLAIALAVLAFIVSRFNLPKILTSNDQSQATSDASALKKSAWSYRHLVLGALGIFCYVGAEVAIGSYLINFMGLPEVAGFEEAAAAKYISIYWGGAMVGRFIGSAVLSKYNPGKVLAFNATCAFLLVITGTFLNGQVAMWALLSVGLFNSIMFPTIFTLAIDKLGIHTPQGSGILCMAIVGGAVLPLVQGTLADMIGLHLSYLFPSLCYLYILFYGLKGSKHV